jgi:precorrin-6Y C5,15-methyltransferase (decarboxylating)
MLQPSRGDVIWDIGAGCGSVAIELSLWQKHHKIFAIEHHSDRLACLEDNKNKFGVQQSLSIISGRAPQVLEQLEHANKVFIGGSDGELTFLLEHCWQALPERGVLVASAVTEDTKYILMGFVQHREKALDSHFESTQIMVSRSSELAGQILYRPNLPVTLFKWEKHAEI